jgi:probable rRNA maturation factor
MPTPKFLIHVHREPGLEVPFSISLVRKAAQVTLREQGIHEPCALTVYLTDDSHIQEFNRQYLGIDSPTDVLSFPAAEHDPEQGHLYLGDILLSIPRAQEQSQKAGHALEAEIQLLIVHGVLHLLGHDHAEVEEKQRMWQAQAAILEQLGWDPSIVRET